MIASRQTQEPKKEPQKDSKKETSKETSKAALPETGRFVVQVGAYTDNAKLASVRQKLSAAGLNNYTQQITQNGKQITRVRLGPFSTRQQMEQAAAKVKALGLPVSTYSL